MRNVNWLPNKALYVGPETKGFSFSITYKITPVPVPQSYWYYYKFFRADTNLRVRNIYRSTRMLNCNIDETYTNFC